MHADAAAVAAAFEKYDENSSGQLDYRELRAALQDPNPSASPNPNPNFNPNIYPNPNPNPNPNP